MAKAPAKEETKDVVMAGGVQLPDWMRGHEKTAKVGNVDSTDLIIPRVKLLQKISPELETFDAAKAGRFWHNVMNVDMGPEVDAVPIIMRKTYVLWAPRTDTRGILARCSDGLNWDIPNLEFEVKPKGSPNPVKYKLGKTVHEKTGDGPALSEFGSGIPGDPQSAPAASLTYEMLWYFPDFAAYSPSIILNTRSQVKPAKALLTKIDLSPVDHFYCRYRIGSTVEKGDEGDFYNITFTSNGFVDQELGKVTGALYERFKDLQYRANDERDDEGDKSNSTGGHRPSGSGPSDSSKF